MQLCGFRDAVRQTTASSQPASNAGGEDERSTVRVRLEGRQGSAEGEERCLDVYGEAGIPILNRGGVKITVCGEACVALELWSAYDEKGDEGENKQHLL